MMLRNGLIGCLTLGLACWAAEVSTAQQGPRKPRDPAAQAKMAESGHLMGPGVAEGKEAPDFELKLLKAYDLGIEIEGKPPETIKLSQFKGDKPVVLIFGSYT
jgi:hypothetical protein